LKLINRRKIELKENNYVKLLQEICKKNKLLIYYSCDYLIIGDFNNGKEKKGIVISSRVHPGETMASYVMEYMIDFLTGNT
jgi:hypothetical protein